MVKYKKLDFLAFEQEILKFWNEDKFFVKSLPNRKEAKPFVLYEDPPSANGNPVFTM